jgi:hypothetical protein
MPTNSSDFFSDCLYRTPLDEIERGVVQSMITEMPSMKFHLLDIIQNGRPIYPEPAQTDESEGDSKQRVMKDIDDFLAGNFKPDISQPAPSKACLIAKAIHICFMTKLGRSRS